MAVAVGVAAFGGSLTSAETSLAAVPAAGTSCVSADGKINGRGSTYQENANAAFFAGFRDDVCGAATGSDQAATNMGIYNYSGAAGTPGSYTGSGNGLIGANCRTDAFYGTDSPYKEAELTALNGTPGGPGFSTACSTFPGTLGQPFPPDTASNGSTYPAIADAAAPVMAIPIAGSSVGVGVNLTAANCGGTKPGPLNFTGIQMSAIMGGGVAMWNDASLTSNNASLAGCNIPIQRVVRSDKSGTTGILKNFLVRADDARTVAGTCAAGQTWTAQGGSAPTWPTGTLAQCSALVTAAGSPALITALGGTTGGIGYADLSDEAGGVTTYGYVTANIQNGAQTAFVGPGAGKQANCDFSVLGLPGFSQPDAVGLNPGDNWGSDNNTVNGKANHVNATDVGVKYPICGITFDLVYSGLADGTVANPIAGLTADQRRTLYSYFTYVLSGTAQNRLASIYYAPLPSAWLPKLQGGFQGAF